MKARSFFAFCFSLLVLLFCCLVFAAGCGLIQERQIRKDYLSALDAWTRHADDYANLDTKLLVTATYKSLPFRKAYVDQHSHSQKSTEEERQEFLKKEAAEAENFHEFLLVFYTPDKSRNILDRVFSPWNIFLVNDQGERVKPLKVVREFDDDKTLEFYFPYANVWSNAYKLHFPKYLADGTTPLITPQTRSIKLVITSILGHCEMEWKL